MTTIEKVAYMKGLMEGMKIDDSTNEGKLFRMIADILEDLSKDMADMEDYVTELTEQVDAVDEDLCSLEEDFYEEYDEDDDCDDCDCCCGDDDEFYEVTCPSCGVEFEVDEDTLLDGGVDCPGCGERLDFDFSDDEDDESEDEE